MPSSISPAFRHARRIPRRHVLRALAVLAVAVVAFVGTSAVALYREYTANISSDYALDDFRTDEPTNEATEQETAADPKAGQPYNLLVIGSDSRQGENASFGDDPGARSDTTILVHISADRSRVEAVSIPRDLMIDIPSCQMDSEGTRSYEQYAQFNAAFSAGAEYGDIGLGAICTTLTVEQMTGLTIDDYAVVDFVGFERMVDTIGGVPMCIPEAVQDSAAGLDLEAGYQTLNGEEALALARARKNLGDGSDLQRIDRQQELMAAIVRQVLATNPFTDTVSLIKFLDAVTSSLTTSSGLSNPVQLAGLAMAVAPVGADGVTFVTMPYAPSGARVVENSLSEEMWERLRNDEPLHTPTSGEVAASPDTADGDGAEGTEAAGSQDATSDQQEAAQQEATSPSSSAGATGDVGDATEEPTPEPTDPWTVTTGSDGVSEAAC